ncbi:MAG: PDZ domain-containing protein, partial [Methanobacteriota archaeon]
NLVKKVVTDILKYGKVKRALLGVSIEPVTDRVARALKLPRPYGALVQGVHKGYPAEDAGFQQGDIILKVNGEEVASVNDLQIKIAQHHPGDKVELTVWRDGKEWLVTLELGEAPGYQVPETKTYHPENLEFKNLGLTIRDLESEDRVRFEVEKGVFIEKVASGSPADDAGVFPTSVLLSVNGTEVSSVSHFEELLQAANPGDVLVLKLKSPGIEFGDGTRLVFVEVPEKIQ